jgi:hypothetical protein
MTWKKIIAFYFIGHISYVFFNTSFATWPQGYSTAQFIVTWIIAYSVHYIALFIIGCLFTGAWALISRNSIGETRLNILFNANILAIVIAALMSFGHWYGYSHAQESSPKVESSIQNDGSGIIQPVIAMATVQDSEGVTEADFDLEGLKNLEEWITQMAIEKGRQSYLEMGYDPKKFDPKVTATSVYLDIENRKLAVIRLIMGDSARSVTVIGVDGKSLIRVSCVRPSNHDILIFEGECGEKVRKSFNISPTYKNNT